MTDFTTPPVKYATFNTRVIASLLDISLVLIVSLPVKEVVMPYLFAPVNTQHVAQVMNSNTRTIADMWQLLIQEKGIERFIASNVMDVFFIGLYIIPCWLYCSTTLGKIVTRIEVRDAATGGPMTRHQCFRRFFGYIVSGVPLTLGFMWVLTNRKRRGWHDYIAGTVVVVKQRKKQEAAETLPASSVHPSVSP
jgi:uncharacterized RDD family membrane protein YckC